MSDQLPDQRGVFHKFIVRRTDGKDAVGEKHERCAYFVLDLDHDPFAIPALRAYAEACKESRPALSADLLEVVSVRPCGCRSLDGCTHFNQYESAADALAAKIAAATPESEVEP